MKYTKAFMEVVDLQVEDVIVTSTCTDHEDCQFDCDFIPF